MEFSIIKILDGIFLANRTVMTDYQFIANNKISHLVAWLSEEDFKDSGDISEKQALGIMGMMGINHLVVPKIYQKPSQAQIDQSVSIIKESRDEQLCCLIISDQILDNLWFVLSYLNSRFNWSSQTALGFIQKKLKPMGVPNLNITLDQIRNHNHIQQQFNNKKSQLKDDLILNDQSEIQFLDIMPINSEKLADKKVQAKIIRWQDQQFLGNYVSDDCEEMLLVKTIKNTFISEASVMDGGVKNKKKIKWFDQTQKNSITAGQRLFANSRISTSIKKNQGGSQGLLNYSGISYFPTNSSSAQLIAYGSRPASGKKINHFSYEKSKVDPNNLKPVLKNCAQVKSDSDYEIDDEDKIKQFKPSMSDCSWNKKQQIEGLEKGIETRQNLKEINFNRSQKQFSIIDDNGYSELKEFFRANSSLVKTNQKRCGTHKNKKLSIRSAKSKYMNKNIKRQFQKQKADEAGSLKNLHSALCIGVFNSEKQSDLRENKPFTKNKAYASTLDLHKQFNKHSLNLKNNKEQFTSSIKPIQPIYENINIPKVGKHSENRKDNSRIKLRLSRQNIFL